MLPTPKELRTKALLFWPRELLDRESRTSILPKLLASQDSFIGLLHLADGSPTAWIDALKASEGLPPNLFLKHLMVLSDIGGENLMRLRPQLRTIFPDGNMHYVWHGSKHAYKFAAILDCGRLSNTTLQVDGKGLASAAKLDAAKTDVAMLLLHGAASLNDEMPAIVREKCVVGGLLGCSDELARYVKQRYILVSRITTGATTNKLGQIAQAYVKESLEQKLPRYSFTSSGTIPGISQNAGKTNISFDIVVFSPKKKCTAIEVSFQFTTNSVIERKAGQAQARQRLLHDHGHRIAYVIDGAGNFERVAALGTICQFSDCTVTMAQESIEELAAFVQDR